jgi:hypothetical protein
MTETDWENDTVSDDGTYHILSDPGRALRNYGEDHLNLRGVIISPPKKASINRIMDEFYVIFSQEWTTSSKKSLGSSETESLQSTPQSPGSSRGKNSLSSQSQKRKRGDDESSPSDDDENGPKKSEPISTIFGEISSGLQFACPYYKRNSGRYRLNHESRRSCALKKFQTIARMK